MDNTIHIVDKILGDKLIQGKRHYHVAWVGYQDTTWEPSENLENNTVFAAYKKQKLSRKRKSQDQGPLRKKSEINISVNKKRTNLCGFWARHRLRDIGITLDQFILYATISVLRRNIGKPITGREKGELQKMGLLGEDRASRFRLVSLLMEAIEWKSNAK